MSIQVMTIAAQTEIRNITAKSLLIWLGNVANEDGYGWPSIARLEKTLAINKRTIQRVLQVFVAMGLISRVDRGPHRVPGLQLNMAMLGTDLNEQYKATYLKVQSKGFSQCRSDAAEDVAATLWGVAATLGGVAATSPPHPLIGVTVNEPSVKHPPTPQRGEEAEKEQNHAGKEETSTKDMASDGVPKNETKPARVVAMAEDGPQDNNQRAADRPENAAGELRRAERSPVREDAAQRGAIQGAAIKRAIDQVMQGCSFSKPRLRMALRGQILQRADTGEEPATIALAMIDAWKRYSSQGQRLRVRWSAANFFSEGHWRNSQGWHWDTETLREERRMAEARIGSWG